MLYLKVDRWLFSTFCFKLNIRSPYTVPLKVFLQLMHLVMYLVMLFKLRYK